MFTTPSQVKTIVQELLEKIDLTSLIIGTVSSISPIKIRVNQRLEIPAESLYFCKNVIPWQLDANHHHAYSDTHAESNTGEPAGEPHTHPIQFTETEKNTQSSIGRNYILEEPLKVGDKVLMLKNLGGQEYILLDKLRQYQQIITD